MLDFLLNYTLPALVMIVGAVAAFLVTFYAYYRITARGYTPPAAFLLVIGGWMTGLLFLLSFTDG